MLRKVIWLPCSEASAHGSLKVRLFLTIRKVTPFSISSRECSLLLAPHNSVARRSYCLRTYLRIPTVREWKRLRQLLAT